MGNILLVTTGGTIGAHPYEDPENPPLNCTHAVDKNIVYDHIKSRMPKILSKIKLKEMKPVDSKEIIGQNINNRRECKYYQSMIKKIRKAPQQKVLVTVGTDRIAEIAEAIRSDCMAEIAEAKSRGDGFNNALFKKIIILTGSMTPLENKDVSDGPKNLTLALSLLTEESVNMAPNVRIVLCAHDAQNNWAARSYDCDNTVYRKRRDGGDGRYYYLEPVLLPMDRHTRPTAF